MEMLTEQDLIENGRLIRKKPNFKTLHQSFENILVNDYIEHIEDKSLKSSKFQPKRKNIEIESPYLQKLSHSNFRGFSAGKCTFDNTISPNKKTCTEHKSIESQWLFNNNNDKYEAYKSNTFVKSARSDVYNSPNLNTNTKVKFINTRPCSAQSNTRNINIMKQPNMIKAIAFRNGNPHFSVFIAAKNIIEFLKLATDKLELTRAARRIFLENGEEVRDQSSFFKNIPVYISSGEEFVDPFAKTKRIVQTDTLWFSDGIRLLFGEVDAPKPVEYNNSQMKSIKFMKRLVAFINGQEYKPVVVSFETKNLEKENAKVDEVFFDDFLKECTSRLKLTRPAVKVFNWFGEKLESINDVPKLDICLKNLVCDVEYSPVWISTGEGFDAFGPLKFIEKLMYEVTKTKRKFLDRQSKLENISKDLKTNKSTRNYIKLQKLENVDLLKKNGNDLSSIIESIKTLKGILEHLESLFNKQKVLKDQNYMKFDDFQVIKKSKKPLKLTILVNGCPEDDFFNVLIDYKDMKLFENILSEIETAYSKHFNSPYLKFTRVFDEDGIELEAITYEHQGKTIWVSTGDDWKHPKLSLKFSVSMKLNMVVPVPLKACDVPGNPFETEQNTNLDRESDKETPGNPFESEMNNTFNFKTILQDLRSDWLMNFSKSEDWDILTEETCIKSVNYLIATSNAGSNSADFDREINQKKVLQLMLQAKNNMKLLIYPQIDLSTKVKLKPKESIWNSKFQIWKFNKEGLIYNGFFKKLCLCVNTQVAVNLEFDLKQGKKFIQKGYMVSLSIREQSIMDQSETKNSFEANKSTDIIQMNQKWGFNKQGNIVTKFFDKNAFCLTSLNVLTENLNSHQQDEIQSHEIKVGCDTIDYKIEDISLVVMEPFWKSMQDYSDSLSKSQVDFFINLGKSQQWAIRHNKAEAIRNREWRLSTLTTNKWGKQWFSWPINEDENLIEEYTWPISGYLIPSAPPLKQKSEQEASKINVKICKNGSADIVGPINLPRIRQIQNSKKMKASMKRNKKSDTKTSNSDLELLLFLDECTDLLSLPSAARRIFSEMGAELKNLETLYQDQLIYVSMGEPWIEPKTIKEELDRKRMLVNLADDLNKLAFFNILINDCQNFVIETDDEMKNIFVEPCFLNNKQLERFKQGEVLESIFGTEKVKTKIENNEPRRAHHMSHDKCDAEEKKKFHWPWEKIKNKSLENLSDKRENALVSEIDDVSYIGSRRNSGQYSDEDEDVNQLFDSLSITKPIAQNSLKKCENTRFNKLSNQMFSYDKLQGFIYRKESPDLVLGVNDINANQIEVYLMKKNEDNPLQRWIYSKCGSILLKCQQNLALTVKLPSLKNVDVSSLYHRNKENTTYLNNKITSSLIQNSPLILQNLIDTEYGNVNQKWYIDDNIEFIFAFAPTYDRTYDENDQLNMEITAANKAQICSVYVGRDKKISQPGYLCEYFASSKLTNETDHFHKSSEYSKSSVKQIYICNCCAVSVYGKYKLTKLTKNEAFVCFFGLSNEKMLRQYGGFKHLYDKVDLSSQEKSENAFLTWKETLIKLREMTVVKPIFQEISAAQTKDIIKLYAYKNGNGRLKPGELLIGTSLDDLLELATSKLGLNLAARRIYTQDGTVILGIQDLVVWCVDYYKKILQTLEPTEQKNTRRPKSSLSNPSDKLSIKDTAIKSASTLSSSEDKKGLISQESSYLNDYSFYSERKSNRFKKPNKYDLKRLIFDINQMKTPDAKKVLKWPVEVWISAGEDFIHPAVIDGKEIQKNKMKQRVKKIESLLDKKNHELRQIKGKRMVDKSIGELVSTNNLDIPVVNKGHWSNIPYDEQLKQKEVELLKNVVNDIKTPNKKIETSISYSNKNSVTKRVFVYNNGYSFEKTQSCLAASLYELSEEAREKLKLTKPVKLFFSTDGTKITKFDQIRRDQVICISTGSEFIPESQTNRNVEIRANWSRIRKEEGFAATLINVNSNSNPNINVDPFAPQNKRSQFLSIKD